MTQFSLEHDQIILKFIKVLQNKADTLNLTSRIAAWIYESFAEYRDLGVSRIEQNVTNLLYTEF